MNWTYFPERMLGSSIIDRPLLNNYGDTVGNLEDHIIDSTNKVTKLLISTGKLLGIGGEEVAIPFRPLGFSFGGVEYDITAEQLASMPADAARTLIPKEKLATRKLAGSAATPGICVRRSPPG